METSDLQQQIVEAMVSQLRSANPIVREHQGEHSIQIDQSVPVTNPCVCGDSETLPDNKLSAIKEKEERIIFDIITESTQNGSVHIHTPSPESSPEKGSMNGSGEKDSDGEFIYCDDSEEDSGEYDDLSSNSSPSEYSSSEDEAEIDTLKSKKVENQEGTSGEDVPAITQNNDQLTSERSGEELPHESKEIYFSEVVEENGSKSVFHCNICKHKSTTIRGIKTHITKAHNVLAVKKEKDICRNCKKQIHDNSSAGSCVTCNGKEHYRCTKTSKMNENEYKNGNLPFKCSMCCAPELWNLLQDDKEQESNEMREENQVTGISAEEENKILKLQVSEFEENTKCIIKEAQGISNDNTRLVQEISRMTEELEQARMELSKLLLNNKALAVENTKLKQSNKETISEIRNLKSRNQDLQFSHNLTKKKFSKDATEEISSLKIQNKDLQLTHQKAQEVAISIKNRLLLNLKDAENQIREKNKVIAELTKSNEKLIAENKTHEEITANLRETRKASHTRTKQRYGEHEEYMNSYDNNSIAQEMDAEERTPMNTRTEKIDDIDETTYSKFDKTSYRFGNSINNRRINTQGNNNIDHTSASKRNMSRHEEQNRISNYDDNRFPQDNRAHNGRYEHIEAAHHEFQGHNEINTSSHIIDDSLESQGEGSGKREQFCHFFNRNGCTRINCEFLHDIAPPCRHFMNGRCTRRFCGFTHPRNKAEDQEAKRTYGNFQGRRPIHPGETKTKNQSYQQRRPVSNIIRNNQPSFYQTQDEHQDLRNSQQWFKYQENLRTKNSQNDY